MADKVIRSDDIRNAMLKRFAQPEWTILWEVANATGANSRRYADAIMMSLWPSRGLELHGVEIKISRSDWKREAADPTKAEEIARYCDRWWVHTAPNVVDDVSDIPPKWGLREFNGKRWKTIKEAELSDAEPMDRKFLASLLRRAGEGSQSLIRTAIDTAINDERKQIEDRIKREVEGRSRHYEQLQKSVLEFEEAFGAKITSDWSRQTQLAHDAKDIGAVAAALVRARLAGDYNSVDQIVNPLKEAIANLETVSAEASRLMNR